MSNNVVGAGGFMASKNLTKAFQIKKMLASAVFNPEYLEFFIDCFVRELETSIGHPIPGFEFNDANKEIAVTLDIPNVTDLYADKYIRNAFGNTMINISNSGRMCDILYLIDSEIYNTFKNSFIYGTNQGGYNDSELFTPNNIANLFNINNFGNGRYVLSLIQ